MAQYPIPQFIESEAKIIFFLTFRQFFLLVGGGAVCLGLYFILPFFLFAVAAIIILSLVAIIAFLKIDNMPVVKFVLNFIRFSMSAKHYTWKKRASPYPFKVHKDYELRGPQGPDLPAMQSGKLNEAKKIIDTKK